MNIRNNIKNVLDSIEIDDRLLETPQRAERALNEFFNGYDADIDSILNVKYPSEIDDLIILKHIPFESHCEHHMVPIVGRASVGYIPNGMIIGASKLARLVDAFAHRLQLQERMTMQVANALHTALKCKGVAVLIEGEHFCISHRGIKKHDSRFVTRYFTGCLKSNYDLRREFLDACQSD